MDEIHKIVINLHGDDLTKFLVENLNKEVQNMYELESEMHKDMYRLNPNPVLEPVDPIKSMEIRIKTKCYKETRDLLNSVLKKFYDYYDNFFDEAEEIYWSKQEKE